MRKHIKKWCASLALITLLMGNSLMADAADVCSVVTTSPRYLYSKVTSYHTHTDRATGVTYKCATYDDYYEVRTICLTCRTLLKTETICEKNRHASY